MNMNKGTIYNTYQQGLAAKEAGERGCLFHGSVCKSCDSDIRYVSTGKCQHCQTNHSKKYNGKHKETVKKRAKAHMLARHGQDTASWREIGTHSRFNTANQVSCLMTKDDRQQVRDMYTLALKMNEETGIEHELDHVISFSIGGFHHPDNIQIISRNANRVKHNKLDIDEVEKHFNMPIEDIAAHYYPENDFMRLMLDTHLKSAKQLHELKSLIKEGK